MSEDYQVCKERGQMGKLITVMIPCYNEALNVVPMHDAVAEQFSKYLPGYDYRILFIDNHSTDGTRDKLRVLCASDCHTQAILNSRNFGQFNSPYYGMCQAEGDCVISMCCDFQDPPSLIPRLVHEWEQGHDVVCAIKASSEENGILRWLRSIYYKLIHEMSSVDQIEHFTGTGLYDRSFIEVMKRLDDPQPFLRGIVAELGPANRKDIPYEQAERRAGKTHNNFSSLYDAAMLSFTSYTKAPMRIATLIGIFASVVSLCVAILYFVMKMLNWATFPAGSIPVLLAVLVLGSLQLTFIGILGEYVLTINSRTLRRPLVIEEERLGEWMIAAERGQCGEKEKER